MSNLPPDFDAAAHERAWGSVPEIRWSRYQRIEIRETGWLCLDCSTSIAELFVVTQHEIDEHEADHRAREAEAVREEQVEPRDEADEDGGWRR